jgi:hypothetical protein
MGYEVIGRRLTFSESPAGEPVPSSLLSRIIQHAFHQCLTHTTTVKCPANRDRSNTADGSVPEREFKPTCRPSTHAGSP